MQASDIMHHEVISIGQDSSVYAAVRLMVAKRVSGLVVVDEHGVMVGMLTEANLLHRAEIGTEHHYSKLIAFLRGPVREAEDYLRTHARKVSDLMRTPVVAVTKATKLEEVVETMEKHKVRRIPVLEHGKPVGIISRADLLKALEPMLAPDDVVGSYTDPQLEEAVISALADQPWVPPGLSIAAEAGVITLYGVVSDPREERAVVVLVENTPGVKGVKNQLAYVDVNTGISMTGLG
jgi:CBS domain-containing protein